MRSKRGAILKTILLYIGEATKDIVDLSIKILIYPYQLVRDAGLSSMYTSQQLARQTANLKQGGYLQKIGKDQYVLSSYGRMRVLKVWVQGRLQTLKDEWDGKWRIVIFDVPEMKRRNRSLLRMELRALGLRELQKSVWITPLNIEKELLSLLQLWDIEMKRSSIHILVVERIYGDKNMEKLFPVIHKNGRSSKLRKI